MSASVAALGILTFAIPVTQWLVGKLTASSSYGSLISSFLVILCICLWGRRTKALPLMPSSPSWRAFSYLGCMVGFGLLIINLHNGPVSKITGQARSPFEVIDIILLLPVAEELVFRGLIWSLCDELSRNGSGRVVTLVGTSLLFGVEHLGYWAQTSWPLPPAAILHALSMVIAGICFGSLRSASRSLAVPSVVHMLANGAILLTQ